MSTIIKGMGMPKSCIECIFHFNNNISSNHICTLQDRYLNSYDIHRYLNSSDIHSFPDDCPLVEIPTPHGKLIDSDALADDLEWDANHFEDEHELKFNAASWLRSNQNKVILEAE